MSADPKTVVDSHFSNALSRMVLLLFTPFSIKRWLWLGICAGLMMVGEGLPPLANFGLQFAIEFLSTLDFWKTLQWIADNMTTILVWLSGVTAILFILYLISRWLNSRGLFMMYDCVVNNHHDVGKSWRDSKALGNNLFRFRIGWDLVLFNVYLVVLIIAGVLEWPDVKPVLLEAKSFVWTGWTTMAILVTALGTPGFLIFFMLMNAFLFNLVVPVMYVRRMNAWSAFKLAWREIFRPYFWKCILFFLMVIVSGIVGGMIAGTVVMVLALVTCLVAYVIMLLPFLGNYPLGLGNLPGSSFIAAYQLYFVSQFGPEYRVNWVNVPRGGFPVMMNIEGAAPAVPPGGVGLNSGLTGSAEAT